MCERTLVLKFSGVTILIVQGSNQSNDWDDTLVHESEEGKVRRGQSMLVLSVHHTGRKHASWACPSGEEGGRGWERNK